MTTIGYGRFFTQSIFGKLSITIVVFLGSICTATIVTASNRLFKMSWQEKKAYSTLRRNQLKNQMK
jgi:hypothetical protein